MRRLLSILLIAAAILTACKPDQLSSDSRYSLTISRDTLSFDTVFTGVGTSTKRVMVYNPHDYAIAISRVWMDGADGQGGKSYFSINLDGENDLDLMNRIEVRGHDSLYLFVRAHIDPTDANIPLLVEDNVHILVNGNTSTLHLEAIGWNVERIRTPEGLSVFRSKTFTAAKPYLIYDTVVIQGNWILEPGARLYMHSHASIYALGSVQSNGTHEAPVIIQGDRLDRLFDSVPYAYAAGQWNGIYLLPDSRLSTLDYRLSNTEIRSGNIGLYIQSENPDRRPQLHLINSRIHNHALYGLILINVDAEVANTEISNTASYCLFCAGGKQNFIHTTIASFFNNTNIRIQAQQRASVPAVLIDSVQHNVTKTEATFTNCIITGLEDNNIVCVLDTLHDTPSTMFVSYCYLKNDSLPDQYGADNVYWTPDDTVEVFRQDFYRYKEYVYYDFQLDTLSPAIGIADPEAAALYPLDRLDYPRLPNPDAGCYQHQQ